MSRKRHGTSRPVTPPDPPSRSRAKVWGWLGVLLPVAVVLAFVALGGGEDPSVTETGRPAPDFVLPTTVGTEVSLADVLGDGDALLYFSMGVGCDACFAQIPEIEDALAARGITLVPIMVNPPEEVAREAHRFAIDVPILIDADRRVSRAYGMIGVYGHADRPAHSFALVTRAGVVTWVKHYSTMFVPEEDLLADLGTT